MHKFLFLLGINILGSIAGFFYYLPELRKHPFVFWVFIPDSPESTMLFSLAIFFILLGKKKDFISFLASASVIKYGFWTMFVIAFYPSYFLSPPIRDFYILMFVLHLGMMVQPVFILHTIENKKWHAWLTFFWLGINDFFDYVLCINPLSSFPKIEKVGLITGISTLFVSFGLYFVIEHIRPTLR
jgi:uncharacterized membrane protein YpjA